MRTNRSVMIALGGNALSPKGAASDIHVQFAHTRKSLEAIMHFVDFDYNICITHGNGPQVGDELYRMDLTYDKVPPLPLGVCVAGTQGTIGYMIQQSLQNRFKKAHVDREVVTLVTQVIVDKDDPSINNPIKFVGQLYSAEEAKSLVKKFGWTIKEQNPGEWRRVVPSPLPQYIMHGFSTKTLVDHGTVVLCAGGGGIPVYYKDSNTLEGIDAVIDKDLAAALMGRIIKAHELWIITDVECAYLDFNKASQRPIKKCTESEAKQYLKKGQFQKGSMAPKFEAALYFLKHHGEKVIITSISHVKEAIGGRSGTVIVRDNAA